MFAAMTMQDWTIVGVMVTAGVALLGFSQSSGLKKLWNADLSDNLPSPGPTTEDENKVEEEDWLTFALTERQQQLVNHYLDSIQKGAPNADYKIWYEHALAGSSIPEVMHKESEFASSPDNRPEKKEKTDES